MSQEDVFAKLKKDVRSLLMSSKMGLEPERLRRDYINMLGHPMPLKQLGFRSILDMANEMPDVVTVNYNKDGNAYLKAVSDEATRNIEELVAKQRVSKADVTIKKSFSYTFSRHRRGSFPVVLPRRGRAPPSLPALLRMQLRLLISQGAIRLSNLEQCYLHYFGYPLHVHNFGFYSIGEMLDAAKDLISVQPGRHGTVLVLRKHMIPRPLITPFISSRNTEPKMPASLFSDNGANIKAPEPTKPSVSESPLTQPSETTSDPVSKESAVCSEPMVPEKSHEPKPVPIQDTGLFQDRVFKLEEELRQQILENGVAGTVSQELKDKLRKVVGQKSGEILIHELPVEYKKLYEEDLPFLESGFVSVTELVGALSDTFHLKPAEGDSGHQWIVVDVKDEDSKKIESDGDVLTLPVKSSYFSFKASPWEGKQGNETDDDEEEDFTAGTENEELGHPCLSTTEEMMSGMYPDIEVHFRPTLPLDALLNQRLKPPTRHTARELIEVMVEQVESPGNFYISFCDSEESQALKDMMFEMRLCYTCPVISERYHLLKPFVRQGQVCCVSPKGMWFYRVVIHKVLNATQVEVYCVDYGDTIVVQSNSLMFLKSIYSVLPAQAVPSSLTGIKPTSANWTPEATASFQKLCSDRTLVGVLDGYKGDVLQLYLCDTHTDQDIYAHTVLINQGHGVACSSAASAACCVQVSPVSLYFGEGLVDLPEVSEELILSFKSDIPEQSTEASQIGEEVPGLELIEENEFGAHFQAVGANPFSALFNNPTLSCSGQSTATTDEAPPTSPTSPASAALADVIQARESPVTREGKPKEILTPPPTPSSSDSSSCPPQEEAQTEKCSNSLPTSPLSLKTLSLHTSHLSSPGQIQDCFQGAPVSPLYLQNFGHLFPLFGARFSPPPLNFQTTTKMKEQLFSK